METIKEEIQETPKSSGSFWLLPVLKKTGLAISSFSNAEKIFFWFFAVCAVFSGIAIFSHINQSYMTSIPLAGGSFTEGIIGTPRLVNPVLAESDADKDLTALVYSGLLRIGKNGELVPDLAEKYEISPDGLTYTFILKEGLTWSDGVSLTSDDIQFTIEKIQDQDIRSPKKAEWDGVVATAKDKRTVTFTLKKPYALFIENAAVGIIPKHLWENLSANQFGFSSYNTNPIGSGPYMVEKVKQNASGIPEYYDLAPFSKFTGGVPFIQHVRIRFYTGEEKLIEAYNSGEAGAISAISPKNALSLKTAGARVETIPLPRIFGVFLNQNEQEIFTDPAVRSALDKSVDKGKLIDSALFGYGTEINGPFPPGIVNIGEPEGAETSAATTTETITEEERINIARNILIKNGWSYNEETRMLEKITKGNGKKNKQHTQALSFSLSTSDAPELRHIGEKLKQTWEKMGAKVNLKIFEEGGLKQNAIRPRKYDALLYGEIVGRNPDPYAFWHSSQRFFPGVNIALYTNITSDKLLEKARSIPEKEKRLEMYASFQKEIARDLPAIFLYSPSFIYVLPKNLGGVDLSSITLPMERFANIKDWYVETQNVWEIFAPQH